MTNLRNLLAKLYPDEASMRRLLGDAGIPARQILLNSSAINNWHSILMEAENTSLIDILIDCVLAEYGTNGVHANWTAGWTALIDCVLAEYGTNLNLQEIVGRYRSTTQQSHNPSANAELEPSSLYTTIQHADSQPVDIFLGYSRSDNDAMQRLRNILVNAGVTVWIDDLNLVPGTPDWQQAIEEAIEVAKCVVVTLSPTAKGSKWVARELGYAEQVGRVIFPVLLSGDPHNALPLRLINHHQVDLRKGWDPVQERLVPALKLHLQQQSNPSNPLQPQERREGTDKPTPFSDPHLSSPTSLRVERSPLQNKPISLASCSLPHQGSRCLLKG